MLESLKQKQKKCIGSEKDGQEIPMNVQRKQNSHEFMNDKILRLSKQGPVIPF